MPTLGEGDSLKRSGLLSISLLVKKKGNLMRDRLLLSCLMAIVSALVCSGSYAETPSVESSSTEASVPNVLFIAMDDLNDWIGCLGGHPQTITPNLDRLAASGILFNNAHCPAPACNPCRSAIFTGRSPHRSGMYDNRQAMREIMPTEVLIPQHFRNNGYRASGSGKMLHYFIEAASWDEYYPAAETENPLPDSADPKVRPASLPRGGPWQYVDTDWAALDMTDEEFGGDWLTAKYVSEQLNQKHDKPFFLACGLYRPHEPWFVPKKYFEPFPLESIQLPPGYKPNDLDDVPAVGASAARNRYFAHIQEQGQWKQGIQGYLASIHFADAMLGRVLDALEASPNADNTIVVLWSDHGWQLGEKEHWQKYTPWRAVTRVPLMVRVPAGISTALPSGTAAGTVCDAPVNLLSLYPTLIDLCGLPKKSGNDGPSILPLLSDPANQDWTHSSVTYLSKPGSYSVSNRTHQYIHYYDGSEELYDLESDPFEWTNLASLPSSEAILEAFRRDAPKDFHERVEPSVDSLVKLPWFPSQGKNPPVSVPDGNKFPIFFTNKRAAAVELCLVEASGQVSMKATVDAGSRETQRSRPGEVWLIRDAVTHLPLGHFVVDDRTAEAIIPAAVAK
ncbi:Arylsulfatase A [Neorhodopirellula lusitana]|uniref:Arylsulfatase A n=2 Tax=Neorhodopirellula lusitana TaxID=445327 RepID=A0ABY1QCI7_9BACT|nr:Arylsulfatase A [Neorhodopirellula lusitana]